MALAGYMRTIVTGAAAAALMTSTSLAASNDVYWINPAGGAYSEVANWSTGALPDTNDVVLFTNTTAYEVTYGRHETNGLMVFKAGNVTLNLNGYTNFVTRNGSTVPVRSGSFFVAYDSGDQATTVIVTNGGVRTVSNFQIGYQAAGTLIVTRGGVIHSGVLGAFSHGWIVVTNGGQGTIGGNSLLPAVGGKLTVDGSNSVLGGVNVNINGSIDAVNGGRLEARSNFRLYNGGTCTLDNATLLARGTIVYIEPTATLRGHGTINYYASAAYMMTNWGMVQPGNTATGQIGALVFTNGTFDQPSSGRLEMELAGSSAGQYDRLYASTFKMGGTCTVSLVNGFAPTYGDRFQLFQWTSAAGSFAAVNLPALSGKREWNTNDLYVTGELSVFTIPKGTIIFTY